MKKTLKASSNSCSHFNKSLTSEYHFLIRIKILHHGIGLLIRWIELQALHEIILDTLIVPYLYAGSRPAQIVLWIFREEIDSPCKFDVRTFVVLPVEALCTESVVIQTQPGVY